MREFEQIEMEETEEYKAFVDKFKPKKTTDDCYTPPLVYEAVLQYCVDRYGIDRDKVLRPFYPGGDYEHAEYPEDCVVIDNPPFSILSKIKRFYMDRGIKFFLFAPYLTLLSSHIDGVCGIVTDVDVVYENGAKVNTSFVTNMESDTIVRADPQLCSIIESANLQNIRQDKKELPKYKYPDYVLTSTMLGYMAKHGISYELKAGHGFHIRHLDNQKAMKKTVYGAGYLLSEKAAAEKAAAEKAAAEKAAAEKAAAEKAAAIVWQLSDRQWQIVKSLGKDGDE